MFKQVIDLCLERRLAFEVCIADGIDEDDPRVYYLPYGAVGTDFRFISIVIGNHQHIVYDYDTETLTELYNEILSTTVFELEAQK